MSFAFGTVASGALLVVYFGALAAVSGWDFTLQQFGDYWPYVIALSAGFGLQVALYVHLRRLLSRAPGAVIAASGTTSTAAMISCCAHYLANLIPVIGATGITGLVSQYQIELFWIGLAFNAAGAAYIGRNLVRARREHVHCLTS